jgi:hypothetical protein
LINVSSGRDVYAATNKKHFHHGLKVDCLCFLQVPLDVNDIRGISCSAGKSATHLDMCINLALCQCGTQLAPRSLGLAGWNEAVVARRLCPPPMAVMNPCQELAQDSQ